jgi:hypothetical protein
MNHPTFGRQSRVYLGTCETRLVLLMEETIRVGMDFAILCGHRGQADQNDYFRRGLSKKEFPESRHNLYPSKALDLAPWPIDWEDINRFYHLVGIIRCKAAELDIPIRCGLDWDNDFDLADQTFMDLGHVELIGD